MNKTLIVAFVIIILLLAGGLGYFIYQNQKLISQTAAPSPLASAATQQSAATATPKPTLSPSPASNVKGQIEAALNSKNYAALASYMINPISAALMSTECCQPMTPAEAAKQLEYVKGAEPFDFNQQNSTIVSLKAKNPQLADTFIGLSKNGEQLAAFTIDATGKITGIQLAISYKLYTQ